MPSGVNMPRLVLGLTFRRGGLYTLFNYAAHVSNHNMLL